jgi:RecJ-like exonuclease
MDEYNDWKVVEKGNNNPELVKGHEYILKRTTYDPFYILVLDVTEKTYHFKYENGNTFWVEKDYYSKTYTFVEDITSFKIQKNVKAFMEQEFENCGMCNGTGEIPDDGSTSGTRTCMVCGGSGQVMKTRTFKELK